MANGKFLNSLGLVGDSIVGGSVVGGKNYAKKMKGIYRGYDKFASESLNEGISDAKKTTQMYYGDNQKNAKQQEVDPTIPKPVSSTPSDGVYIETIHSGKTPENIDSNTFSDIKKIYDYKKDWVAYDKAYKDALEAGDEALAQNYLEKRNLSEVNAGQHYDNLDKNYSGIANDLKLSSVDNAYKILNMYAKNGKSAFRPYVSSVLTEKYGMSQDDIDKAITYDEDTGEVSLGGINLGKPYSEVDGVSYWDESALDNAIQKFTEKNGITVPDSKRTDVESQNLLQYYKDLLDKYTLDSGNAFETAEAKSILDRYDSKGWDAGYNTAAKGAATNGGNLDSFAAANAMRQQAALRQEGEALALAAHNQKIQNIAGILANLGIEVQNDFDRSQTAKINDSNIRYQDAETGYKNAETAKLQSDVTGLVPDEWLPDYTNPKNNKFLTADGGVVKLSNEGGYATLMQNALVTIASNTASAEEKNAARETYNQANTARNILLQSDPELMAQYGHTIKANLPATSFENQKYWGSIDLEKYAIDKNYDATIKGYESDEKISKDSNTTALEISKGENETAKHVSDNERASVEEAAKVAAGAEIEAQKLKNEVDTYGYDTSIKIAQIENAPSVDQKEYIYDQLVDYLNKINQKFHGNDKAQAVKKNEDGTYSVVARNDTEKTGSNPRGIIAHIWKKVGNNELTPEFAKQFFADIGILESEIDSVLKELDAEKTKK